MADIDLKAATPDTSLPSTGFLFGADSQSAASPSVYSTQTVATALLGSTSLTGATITADSPVLNMAQTWNNAAVAFTGLKFNVPTDSSASGSLLMDLQVGGSSKFAFRKDGLLTVNYPTSGTAVRVVGNGQGFVSSSDGSDSAGFSSYGARLTANGTVEWSSTSNGLPGGNVILSRRGAANLRLGAADAAAPVAQTLSVQSVVAGTTNTAGANLTITGSQGTGTGAGGSIVFQVAPAGSSGTAQNALADALTIASNRTATFAGNVTAPNFITAAAATASVRVRGDSGLFTLGASDDVIITRDAANTLALRNGANGQTQNVYGTYTDASNYRRVALAMTTAGVATLKPEGAGTGASGNVIHISGLPTSNPGPGILWNNAGTPAIGT